MRRHVMLTTVAAVAFAAMAGSAVAQKQDQTFSSHWHDGQAEIDGYRLKISRYGKDRDGYAVMIFVTEPFSESKRVKVDDPSKNRDDVFDAIKLNFVRDFQTGVYDYNTMVSVFARTSDFEPVKLTFSSAEWCGHVFLDLRLDPDRIEGHYSSYFEGETGPVKLKGTKNRVLEDELFLLLRGLKKDYLEPGGSVTVDYLPGALYARLAHRELKWTKARIVREELNETIAVPAGEFATIRYSVFVDDGREGRFWIEAAYPHRIIKWSLPPDIAGELTGSKRMPYWKYNQPGGQSHLRDIGLADLLR